MNKVVDFFRKVSFLPFRDTSSKKSPQVFDPGEIRIYKG
jgi:hypothetical protein